MPATTTAEGHIIPELRIIPGKARNIWEAVAGVPVSSRADRDADARAGLRRRRHGEMHDASSSSPS